MAYQKTTNRVYQKRGLDYTKPCLNPKCERRVALYRTKGDPDLGTCRKCNLALRQVFGEEYYHGQLTRERILEFFQATPAEVTAELEVLPQAKKTLRTLISMLPKESPEFPKGWHRLPRAEMTPAQLEAIHAQDKRRRQSTTRKKWTAAYRALPEVKAVDRARVKRWMSNNREHVLAQHRAWYRRTVNPNPRAKLPRGQGPKPSPCVNPECEALVQPYRRLGICRACYYIVFPSFARQTRQGLTISKAFVSDFFNGPRYNASYELPRDSDTQRGSGLQGPAAQLAGR